MTGRDQTEPTAREWLIARSVHAELEGSSLTDEQRHIVRNVVLAELIKARDLIAHACPTRESER